MVVKGGFGAAICRSGNEPWSVAPPAVKMIDDIAAGDTFDAAFIQSGERQEPNMKYRIAAWAFVGFAVAGCWALYAFAATPPAMTSGAPIMTLVEFTCPVVLVSMYFNVGVSLYACLVANAATYALLGLIVETLRRRLNHAQ